MRGGWIQIPLLVGHQRPNIECWIGSFVLLRGSGPVLLRNPIFLLFSRGVRTPSGSVHDGATIVDEVPESGSALIAIILILKC